MDEINQRSTPESSATRWLPKAMFIGTGPDTLIRVPPLVNCVYYVIIVSSYVRGRHFSDGVAGEGHSQQWSKVSVKVGDEGYDVTHCV
jgi:hypothetical protein